MRCPKCHYLSFDPEPRCRNCGYDLEVADADLALHTAESTEDEEAPDLTLHDRPSADASPITLELVHSGANSRTGVAERSTRKPRPKPKSLDRQRLSLVDDPVDEIYEEPSRQLEPEPLEPLLETQAEPALEPESAFDPEPEPVAEPVVAPQPLNLAIEIAEEDATTIAEPFRSAHTTEMPLFVKGIAESDLRPEALSAPVEEAPTEEVPIVPATRPPLSVRRTTQEPARAQSRTAERRLGPLDHDLLEDLRRVEREEAARERDQARMYVDEVRLRDEPPVGIEYTDEGETVEPRLRLAAAAIDVGVLGGIAAFVFWATLRLCNVSMSAVGWSALIPFVIFIAVMDLSYLLMFTAAGGQTVGKMLMHIRVVSEDQAIDEPVPMGRAAWRSLLTMVSVVALGLGWLPALFGRGLTFHDRLAHTRVVRA